MTIIPIRAILPTIQSIKQQNTMPKRYIINNRVVTIEEWKKAFEANPNSTVVLRVPVFNNNPLPEEPVDVISPEKARQFREFFKKTSV